MDLDGPRLAVEALNMEHNFTYHLGTVPTDRTTEAFFMLKNVGSAALEIANTWTTCACMSAAVDQQELAPGATMKLHVVYDPGVNQAYGKFIQVQIYIRSNDPIEPLWERSITADVAAQ